MKTLLLFPPQGHFTQPYLSLPSLTAWLKQNGYEDVTQIDVNMQAFDHFLSRGRLTRSLERIRDRERFADLDSLDRLRFSEMERYQALSEIELTSAPGQKPRPAAVTMIVHTAGSASADVKAS